MSEKHKQQEFLHKFLNSSRRKAVKIDNDSSETKAENKERESKTEKKDNKDDWLTKKALEEIERTANIHKVKRESQDLSTSPLPTKTNKKFLINTLSSCLSHNKREDTKTIEKSSNKLKEHERYRKLRNSKQKFGERKHEFKKVEKRKNDDDDDNDR